MEESSEGTLQAEQDICFWKNNILKVAAVLLKYVLALVTSLLLGNSRAA